MAETLTLETVAENASQTDRIVYAAVRDDRQRIEYPQNLGSEVSIVLVDFFHNWGLA